MKQKRKSIFISGHSGSGKTTIAKLLSKHLPKDNCIITTDWFMKHSTNERKKYIEELRKSDSASLKKKENPINWFNLELFLQSLKRTGILNLNSAWNQKTGKKDLSVNINLKNDGIIICEGMYLLHNKMLRTAD